MLALSPISHPTDVLIDHYDEAAAEDYRKLEMTPGYGGRTTVRCRGMPALANERTNGLTRVSFRLPSLSVPPVVFGVVSLVARAAPVYAHLGPDALPRRVAPAPPVAAAGVAVAVEQEGLVVRAAGLEVDLLVLAQLLPQGPAAVRALLLVVAAAGRRRHGGGVAGPAAG